MTYLVQKRLIAGGGAVGLAAEVIETHSEISHRPDSAYSSSSTTSGTTSSIYICSGSLMSCLETRNFDILAFI